MIGEREATKVIYERNLFHERDNKAVYTTASIAHGWAGAVMPFEQLFGKNFNSMTDGPTNQRTDQPMDRQSDL